MQPSTAPGQDNTGVGAGPGPIRHPRPLTAAELHSELEQEQELLVNRLTRDLTMLRAAQNNSVVSNASSTSASASASVSADQPAQAASAFADTHLLSGPSFPVPTTSADRRHQRTSSSTSARSFSLAATAGSTPAAVQPGQPGSAASVLEAARNPRSIAMSRQNSTTSHRSTSQSRTRSPHPFTGSASSSYTQGHGFPHGEHHAGSAYFSGRNQPGPTSAGMTIATGSTPHSLAVTPGSELSPGLMPATLRYEETAHYRQELEAAKRENETLKRRVKELEKQMRERRESDASTRSTGGGGARLRSDSVSTTASISVSGAAGMGGGGTGIAGGRVRGQGLERAMSSISTSGSIAVGVPEDEVKVGESAASAGLAGTNETK
jgi:hypothetical protein